MLNFLLSLVDENSEGKIRYIYEHFHDDMIRFAKSRLKEKGSLNVEIDAEDVVQNSFLKIVKYIKSIDINSPEKRLRTYVFSIVVNEVTNLMSDTKYHVSLDEVKHITTDDELYQKLRLREKYDFLVEKIKLLEEKYSFTLYYYYCEDLAVKTISEMMGIAEKTVYTRLERGRVKLIELLAKETL